MIYLPRESSRCHFQPVDCWINENVGDAHSGAELFVLVIASIAIWLQLKVQGPDQGLKATGDPAAPDP